MEYINKAMNLRNVVDYTFDQRKSFYVFFAAFIFIFL